MFQYIEDCKMFYNYGNIEHRVRAYSFSYDYDKIDLKSLIDFIENTWPQYHIFMFLIKTCTYPVPFLDKHLGLWNKLIKQKTIKPIIFEENVENLIHSVQFYGFAEIPIEQIYSVLKILYENPFNSFIILSKCNSFCEINYKSFIKKTSKEVEIMFSDLINCQTNSNIVITSIRGNDGLMINVFD